MQAITKSSWCTHLVWPCSAPLVARNLRTFKSKPADTITIGPRKGYFPPYPQPKQVDPNIEPYLAHRRIEAFIRPERSSFLRRVRRAPEWIPGFLNQRGHGQDLLLRVPLAPLAADWDAGLLAKQKRGKVKFTGPLYELVVHDDPEGLAENVSADDIPKNAVRVQPMGILIHPITDRPVGVNFILRPPDKAVRVRIPVRYINEEKCPGLRNEGWVNPLHQYIDVQVAAGTKAPLYAIQDVGALKLHERATIGELAFEGKGEGCRTVLPDDEVCTIISKA